MAQDTTAESSGDHKKIAQATESKKRKLSDILKAFNALVHHNGDLNAAWTAIVFTNMPNLINNVEKLERDGTLSPDKLYIPWTMD